ncbi:obscurin [Nilaparvata lugens]|uniref:obscurin n=1 Tax=Nilaparvata lugens TaxID=108931 RepID=UPI00193E081F|nr:obscurin [Nilaparvata lugens]
MVCRAQSSVKLCKWLWMAEVDENPILVEEFPGFGERKTDCSLYLKNITKQHQGLWSCVVKLQNRTSVRAKPVTVWVHDKFVFEEKPANVTAYVGDIVKIPCSSADEMELCQWFYKKDERTVWEEITFMENVKDCSLALSDLSMSDSGFFKCGVKRPRIDESVESPPMYLLVDGDRPFEFAQVPVNSIFIPGTPGSIQCKTKDEAQECRWSWQPQGYDEKWRVKMRQFVPEDGHDCALQLRDISTEPGGHWMCSVLPINSTEFVETEPITLQIQSNQDMKANVLTTTIAVVEGKSSTLRCEIASTDVEECRWRWHSYGGVDQPTIVVRSFPAYGSHNMMCNIVFTSVMYEQQGVWICGVRFRGEQEFKESTPSTVSVDMPGKLRVVDVSQDRVIAEKESMQLICRSASAVDECVWSLTPSDKTYNPTRIEFVPDPFDRRNCSMVVKNVGKKHDGEWKCLMRVERTEKTFETEAKPVHVKVIKPEKIKFDKVTSAVQVLPGYPAKLSCIVSHPVDMCQWRWLGLAPFEKIEFPPLDGGIDCSLNVTDMNVLRDGHWQCGAKNIGQQGYYWGPITSIQVVYTENISTRFWISEYNNHLCLVCRLSTTAPLDNVNCHWTHPNNKNASEDTDSRYRTTFDKETGECIIIFEYIMSDFGQWECKFDVDTENGTMVLGNSKFLMLNNPQNIRLRWVVGLMAAVILILCITLAVSFLYMCPARRDTAKSVGTNKYKKKEEYQKNAPSLPAPRYTEHPTRIDFKFEERPNTTHIEYITPTCSSSSHHLYERVGRLSATTSSTQKTLYQNIDD